MSALTCRAFAACAVALVVTAAPACGGHAPSAPAAPPTTFVAGDIVWVSATATSFVVFDGYSETPIDESNRVSMSGAGIGNHDDLVAAFRRGLQIRAVASVEGDGYREVFSAVSVQFTASGPSALTFNKAAPGVVTTPSTRFAPMSYHQDVVYILPWTVFRQDGDFLSWDAVVAAGGQPMCVSGEGFRSSYYTVQAAKIGVWRNAGGSPSCPER